MKKKHNTNPAIKLPDGLVMGSSLTRQAPEWLWDNYLPSSALCSLEGEKGKGKGTFIYHLMSCVTTGTPMPLETNRRDPAACLLYTAEDHLNIVVKPKLDAAAADDDLYAVRGVADLIRISGDTTPLLIDIDRMEQRTGKKVKLVAIDPLNAVLETSIYNPQVFRKTANALMDVAEQKRVTLLCTRHHTKSGTNLLTRGLGGVEVGNVQRAINALIDVPPPLATEADNDATRLFVPVVCNYVPRQPILKCQLISTAVRINGVQKTFAALMWHGVSAITLEDINRKSRPTPKSDQARQILNTMLEHGERDAADVIDTARAAGVSKETLENVAQKMGVVHEQKSRKLNGSKPSSYWTWRLPDEEEEAAS